MAFKFVGFNICTIKFYATKQPMKGRQFLHALTNVLPLYKVKYKPAK